MYFVLLAKNPLSLLQIPSKTNKEKKSYHKINLFPMEKNRN